MASHSKAEIIAERVANLPKPEDPPVKSDWDSANPKTVNIQPGEKLPELPGAAKDQGATAGLDGAATKGSGVREADGADLSGIGKK